MKRIRIIGFALMAALAFSAMAASAALADEEFGFRAETAKLAAGETREPKVVKVNKAYVLKGEAGGVSVQVECTKQKLAAGAEIKGGLPGTSKETIEFETCTVIKPTNCTGVTVKPTPVNDEIVTVVKPAGKLDALATLFTPQGTNFTELTFTGACGLGTVAVKGNNAGLVKPPEVEQETGNLLFESGANEITEIEHSNGTKTKVELKFGTKKSTLSGETELELLKGGVKVAKWGVF